MTGPDVGASAAAGRTPQIEAVQAAPGPDGSQLLRVAGRWPGPAPAQPPVLLLGPDGARLGALPGASASAARAAGDAAALRLVFLLPAGAGLDGLTLACDGWTVALPAPGTAPPAGSGGDEEDDGTVVDRAVLAERRARRAEALETEVRQRAQAAEAAAANLELELGRLEAAPAGSVRPDADRLAREAALAAAAAPARFAPPAPAGASLAAMLAAERAAVAAGAPVRAAAPSRAAAGRPRRPGSVAAALDHLDQERRAAPELRRTLIRREREVEALREQLDRAAAELRARSDGERAAREAAAGLERAEQGIAAAHSAAGSVRRQLTDERASWQAARAELEQALDRERTARRAAESALRAAVERESRRAEAAERALDERDAAAAVPGQLELVSPQLELAAPVASAAPSEERVVPAVAPGASPEPTAAPRPEVTVEAIVPAAAPVASPEPTPASPPAVPVPPPGDWLGPSLAGFAAASPQDAARLGAGLLAAAGLRSDRPIDADVQIAELGWHAVRAPGGRAAGSVEALSGPRGRGEAQFRLRTDAAGLAALLVRGAGRPAVRGTLRRRRARRTLGPIDLRLEALATAGILLNPVALFRALAAGIDPAWTAGADFAVQQEITGPEPARFWIVAGDGTPVTTAPQAPAVDVRATITASGPAFQRMLAGVVPDPGDKPALAGDAAALAALGDWSARARARLAGAAPRF